MRLPRLSTVTALAVVLAVAWSAQGGAVPLDHDTIVEVAPGTTVDLTVDLVADELLHVVIEQRGVDVALELVDPAGAVLWTRDSLHTTTGAEDVWAVSDRAGRHVLHVAGHGDAAGQAAVIQFERHPADDDDRSRVAAEQDLLRAWNTFRAGTRDDLERARAAAASAAAAFARLGLAARQGAALYQLGMCLRDLGRMEEAVEVFRRGIPIEHQAGNPVGEANLHHALAGVHWRRGDFEAAAAEGELARATFAAAGDPFREGWALNNLAIYQRRLGRVELARHSLEQATDRFRTAGNLEGALAAKLNMGQLDLERGAVDDAVTAFEEVASEASGTGQRQTEGTALHNLGSAYGTLGDSQRARTTLTAALAIRRQEGDPRRVASTLMALGRVDADLGRAARARDRYREALAGYRQVEDRDGEAHALHELGVLTARDDPRAGLDRLREALAIRQEIGDRSGQADSEIAIGAVLLDAGSVAEAAAPLARGLELADSLGDPFDRAEAHYQRARLARARSDLAQALIEIDRALELTESVRAQVAGDELRASWLASVRHYAELKVDVLRRLGRTAEAFSASEAVHARVLRDQLVAVGVPQTGDPELAATLRDAAADVDRRRQDLDDERQAAAPDPERIARLEDALAAAAGSYRQVQQEIRRQQPRRAILTVPDTVSVAEARDRLDADTALLEYLLGDDASYLFVVTDDAVTSLVLPDRAAIAQQVELVRRGLESPGRLGNAAAWSAAHRLFTTLVEPALPSIGDRHRLLVVPDGALHALPFEALLTAPPSDAAAPAWLVRRYAVATAPSVAVLQLITHRPRSQDGSEDLLLAGFADPLTSSDQVAMLRTGTGQLGRLPASRRELEDVAAIVGPRRSLVLLGADATEDRLEHDPRVAGARYLHLATHGLVDDRLPSRTALVMAPGGAGDGLLHVPEIFELQLDNRLVVLSACRTGLGREVLGEGLLGLVQAFLHAGSRSLVVSLWPVSDTATRELMVRFYRHLADHDPAMALTLAKRELLAEPGSADPFGWAAFVLIGEPAAGSD